jgi:pimeloyl-ACP methyl ester carboxylesterase
VLDQLGLQHIVGVGHSLGGVLTLWAAVQRSDLFRAIILIEPVILPRAWLWALRIARALGLRERQPLVRGAMRRRRTWPSEQACFDHFRSKPLFGRWSDAVLMDYIRCGTRPGEGNKVELIYPPEWEAHIFATTPTDIWHDVPRLRVPVLAIRGEHSETFLRRAQNRMARRLPQARFVVMPNAGHLVPMEQPTETGAVIQRFLDSL